MKTWRYIYDEFLEVTKMDLEVISDFRPCEPPYYNVLIPMAIIVWLKSGSSLIYISKKREMLGLVFDFVMVFLTGGLWLIWLLIRYLRQS